jgi:hypothetical protein
MKPKMLLKCPCCGHTEDLISETYRSGSNPRCDFDRKLWRVHFEGAGMLAEILDGK